MKVVKCINNNVAICVDGNNRELVAFGKGIGFKKPPYEIPLKQVERTFYDVDSGLISMIQGIDEKIISLSTRIVDYSRELIKDPVNPSIIFSLADHIDFTIARNKGSKTITLPIVYDIQYLFEKEYRIGQYALKLIQDELRVYLPKEEASYIALHFINAEAKNKEQKGTAEQIIETITSIIEQKLKISINRSGANYARFVTHMHYLLKRSDSQKLHHTENTAMYQNLTEKYPDLSDCVDAISDFFEKTYGMALNEEEKLYLILHVNRLYAREEIN